MTEDRTHSDTRASGSMIFASMADSSPLPPQLIATAQNTRGLELLMLFGSRARRDSHPGSDWDFAYIATDPFDPRPSSARLRALSVPTESIWST